ncbi:glycerophosphoryl diester phosphodiesterase [Opitutaceae bacterium TAV5]|nr:glycerophosphoryl diester phosphodiesterase [Opitutaceae bacterium TAV5]
MAMPFRLIAHRGAPMRAPENTLASFRIAQQLGATEIETDVQLTTDNVLVLCHDDTLARYRLGDRRVEESPYGAAASPPPDGTTRSAAARRWRTRRVRPEAQWKARLGRVPAMRADRSATPQDWARWRASGGGDAAAPSNQHVRATTPLCELDFGSWFSPAFAGERIATLPQLLDTHAADFLFHIELKGAHPRLAAETLAILDARNLLGRSVLTSFSLEQLRRARAASASIRLGWLVHAIDEPVLSVAGELGLFQICPLASAATSDAVARALRVVPEVRAWGCPREPAAARETVRAVQAAGCIGITTDELGWFRDTKPA